MATEREVAAAAFETTAVLHREWVAAHSGELIRAAALMSAAIDRGGRVLSFGNGGSATDAQHLAGELVGRFLKERRALAGLALTADTAILTCLGNDYGFDSVFVRQVEAHGRAGDVAVGITTSGASANVTKALVRARELGLATIALTGKDGGETGRGGTGLDEHELADVGVQHAGELLGERVGDAGSRAPRGVGRLRG